MLDLKQIELFYPESLRPFKRNLLLEYLQYKILEIIFDSEFGEKLAFIQQEDVEVRLSDKLCQYSGYLLTAPLASTSELDFLPL